MFIFNFGWGPNLKIGVWGVHQHITINKQFFKMAFYIKMEIVSGVEAGQRLKGRGFI